MTTTKKAKRLARLRTKQHRRLACVDVEIRAVDGERIPRITNWARTERELREAAERALTDDAREYLRSWKELARRTEVQEVVQALGFRAERFYAHRDRRNAIDVGLPTLARVALTDDIESTFEQYAYLVALADWVADHAQTGHPSAA